MCYIEVTKIIVHVKLKSSKTTFFKLGIIWYHCKSMPSSIP